jgi:hypothetical protein
MKISMHQMGLTTSSLGITPNIREIGAERPRKRLDGREEVALG